MPLRTTLELVGSLPVLSVHGDVDLSTLPALHQAFAGLVADHRGAVVAVDLDTVDALDDVGLGVLLGAAGRARDSGGDLLVVCSSGRLLERLTLTRLDRAIDVHPSAAAAARAARGPGSGSA